MVVVWLYLKDEGFEENSRTWSSPFARAERLRICQLYSSPVALFDSQTNQLFMCQSCQLLTTLWLIHAHFKVDDEETPEATTQLGLRFLDQIKNARDKG